MYKYVLYSRHWLVWGGCSILKNGYIVFEKGEWGIHARGKYLQHFRVWYFKINFRVTEGNVFT